MKNTRSLSCVRAQRTMEATKKSKRGEGYVDSGVKILIAVVIGALLLAGLYFLMNNVILPKADEKVTSMFDTSNEVAGTYEIGADVGGGGTGGGGSGTGTGASAPMRTAAVGTVVSGGTFLKGSTVVAPASNPWAEDKAAGGNLPAYDSGSTYTFGDTDKMNSEKNLKWLKVSDTLFVCDRNLLRSISYDNINAMGFVNGSTTVSIDGNTYKIRLLEKSEWMATDCIGGSGAPFADNSVSHWENCYSWTKTPVHSDYFYLCGCGSASGSDDHGSYLGIYDYGFRPALELVS